MTAIRSSIRPVLRRAAQWLAECGEAAVWDPDLDTGPLTLFAMRYALRPLAADDWPDGISETTRQLAEHLALCWASQAGQFHDRFISGGFVLPMLAAAVLRADDVAAGKVKQICRSEWQKAEAGGAFVAHPTLLWTGRRLLVAMMDDAPTEQPRPWWSSEVSNLTSRYSIAASAVRQLVADVAAMTGYGRFQPPLPTRERDYLRHTLPFLTFYYVKEQDLDMVCPLLRALRYTGITDVPEYRRAIEFVIGRSRTDGSFSMRDLAAHLHARSARPPIDLRRTVHLPLTAASVWALVDCAFPERALGHRSG